MLRKLCKSKIHRVTVTKKNLEYSGSIGIDKKLLVAADIAPNEMVLVVNVNTGSRFETYAIEEKVGSGTISLRGGAARLGEPGDKLIIISSAFFENEDVKSYKPKFVMVDDNNRPIKK
jgi:aspartate 1-decarboxylase